MIEICGRLNEKGCEILYSGSEDNQPDFVTIVCAFENKDKVVVMLKCAIKYLKNLEQGG